MAGSRCPVKESDQMQPPSPVPSPSPMTADLASDDDWSVAADSWSVKSDYGSNVEDEQRHVDAAEVLSSFSFPPIPDYSSDKDVRDANEVETSMLGLQSYWDAIYADDLANFHEHGQAGEVWLGMEVTGAIVTWTKGLCANISPGQNAADNNSNRSESNEMNNDLSSLSVLDIGTGNGLLLQELAKQGFSDLTGTDYSQGAINLARSLAVRDGFSHIKFLVDDILETKLDRKYQLVVDKGTLDSIGIHPDSPVKRMTYWESVSNLVTPGGILVITSCSYTKDTLQQEVETLNQEAGGEPVAFQYLDHHIVSEGSCVAIVAFIRNETADKATSRVTPWMATNNAISSAKDKSSNNNNNNNVRLI